MTNDRRKFLRTSGSLLLGSTVLPAIGGNILTASSLRMGAADKLNVGVIGVNGMGWSDYRPS